MSTTNRVNGSNNIWAALNTQRNQHQSKMVAKVDTDGSGGVNEAELSTMLDDISKKTGTSLGDSTKLFSQMDSNTDGQLSGEELETGIKSLMPPPSTMEFSQTHTLGGSNNNQDDQFATVDTDGDGAVSKAGDEAGGPQASEGQQATRGAGGPPPAGGAGGTKGASSSDTTYDPLDTNQDGVVSEMERMVGELQEALVGLKSGDANSATAANQKIAELAQKIYSQVAQNLSDNNASSLSVTA